MQAALCLGGNLFGSNPDSAYASEAIGETGSRRLHGHDAEQRARLGNGEGDADSAGPAARRRAAADDAGVDVQLRAAERRRAARYPGPRSEVSVLADVARRVLGADGPVELARSRKPPANPRVDGRPDSRLRAARRHRPHAQRVSYRRPPRSTRAAFSDGLGQGAVPRRAIAQPRRPPRIDSCG